MQNMCPACGEPLLIFGHEGVEIDHCASCKGTWLDAGELDQLGTLSGLPPGHFTEALEKGGGDRDAARRCVRCGKAMRKLDVSGVELDRCPLGHGLWFDAREIEALVAATTEGEEARVAAFFRDLFGAELKK
jgi:Zn-finger nucleic acid-binding protein